MIRDQSYEVSTSVEPAASSGIRVPRPGQQQDGTGRAGVLRVRVPCPPSAACCSPAAARCGTCRRAEEGSIGENVAVEEDRDIDIKSPERTNRFKSKGMKGKRRLWKKKNGMKYENKNVMKFINT